MTTKIRPLLVLEINEVPWKVIDRFSKLPQLKNIQKFFASSKNLTTLTVDSGELSPWVTWPSFYRGMSNHDHGIKNLGQDVNTFRGKPLWEEYRDRGLSIGICGTLQSWPARDPGPAGFYIPDTFAHDEKCYPSFLEPLQRFNLRQVQENGRVLNSKIPLQKEVFQLLKSILKTGITAKTYWQIIRQLISERFDRHRLARRPIFQGILFWDVFKNLYSKKVIPEFASFFTNHVASIMHRYWDHFFPEDFPNKVQSGPLFHSETMIYALEVVDKIFSDAMEFQQKHPDLIIAVATSMGQDAVHRDEYNGYSAAIVDSAKFLKSFGASENDFKVNLAMVPQVSFEIRNGGLRREMKRLIEASTATDGSTLFKVDEVGISLTITIETPSVNAIQSGRLRIKSTQSFIELKWQDAGIQMYAVEAGTAYHTPEGILAFRGEGISADNSRARLKASAVKDYLMEMVGLVEVNSEMPLLQSRREPLFENQPAPDTAY